MSDSEVARLRAEALKLHRAATKKISRNTSDKAKPRIAGTRFDPRRDIKNVKRYNAKQLEKYIGTLQDFNSRSNQYVPDAYRRPIPTTPIGYKVAGLSEKNTTWRDIEAARKRLNQIRKKEFDANKKRRLPGSNPDRSGMTIEEYEAMTRPLHPQMHDPASDMGRPIKGSSRAVTSHTKLSKLHKSLVERATPEYRRKLEKTNRRVAEEMIDLIAGKDAKELKKKLRNLTSGQFNLVWNNTGLANAASLSYEIYKKMLDPKQSVTESEQHMASGEVADVKRFLAWAEKQDV